ncbi:ATP-binding protein [Namhaeicola litoreus]|uniref:histidine kinase n=1 Tax=Namhaeicola litoreus TaxID=1052145 RepID=A0ABW3XYI3_9FLAO
MEAIKDIELDKCHINFLNICFSDFPIKKVNEEVSAKITGYGTNINEKIRSFSDFVELLDMQRQESEGLEMKFDYDFISKTVLAEGKAAVFVDEAILTMKIEGNELKLFLRISSVYEFCEDNWKAVHFHGSLPQGTEGHQDTWTVNEWKNKNAELEKIILEKTNDLQKSLEDLKATQAQLIHSEKMASLGELTAGIAHEIQNPLNFVNNFAEVSNELIEELEEERSKENETKDEELVSEILNDLKENLKKINHHGKRADTIVKGMLQHSRKDAGQKELTNINVLADEFLRLTYHGLRAKDKSFNASLETDYDKRIGKLELVQQDIGRVLLNLISNAFYAVQEKSKTADKNYQPTVGIVTKKLKDSVEIIISDNGSGIPEAIKEKIFQPFFTTKPTGSGTGLGLSLSYDIAKAHQGELRVKSEEGEGSSFILSLPNHSVNIGNI